MSDINLDFTVSNNEINFTVEPNEITFTPSDIQLTINPAFTPVAGGVDGDVQFNSGGNLVGYPTFKFYYLTNTLSVTNLIANASNFTSNISNIHITGGTNGYVLQTDGLGNLSWTAQTGGGGNGTPGGSNTQIQFNDNGLFGGNTGFTFDKTNGNVGIPGNLNVTNTIYGTVANANFASYAGNANIANIANSVAGANVTGEVAYANTANNVVGANVTGNVSNATNAFNLLQNTSSNLNVFVTFSNSSSNGFSSALVSNGIRANLANSSLVANNFIGLASNATFANTAATANTAGTVTTAAQPNITSLGTLTSLTAGNVTISTLANIQGNLISNNITSIASAQEKITIGTSPNATFNIRTQGVAYYTSNATANISLNFANVNNVLSNSNSFVGTYILTNGSTPYSIANIAIDGTPAAINWVNGAAPNTVANSLMSYTFTIIKTSTTPTYVVLGTGTSYS